MQEAGHADVACDDLKVDSGADGDCEPLSVVDSATADCPTGVFQTQSEWSVPSEKDLSTNEEILTVSETFTAVDPASGEPASQADGPADDSASDGDKQMEDKNAVVEDVFAPCVNISSGVSHMDIDVSEEVAADSTVSIGILTCH